jgi:hypothetical protein
MTYRKLRDRKVASLTTAERRLPATTCCAAIGGAGKLPKPLAVSPRTTSSAKSKLRADFSPYQSGHGALLKVSNFGETMTCGLFWPAQAAFPRLCSRFNQNATMSNRIAIARHSAPADLNTK